MKAVFIIVGLGVLGWVLFYVFNAFIYNEKQGDPNTYEPYRATLTGTQVCLPHKDTSGPQTLECALGIRTDAGEYYALDLNLMSQMPPVLTNGTRFTASGTITPLERLSSDHLQKYDVEGVFSVTDSVRIESAATTTPTVRGNCYVGGCSSQLCTDTPGAVSTCEYRPEYACYRGAVCERQASGSCGWTQTAALRACLAPIPEGKA